MRSFVPRAVLAVLLVSSSLAGIEAAAAKGSESAAERQQTINENRVNGDPVAGDARMLHRGVDTGMSTGSVTGMQPRAMAPMQYRPRLAHIVREVGAANHRIATSLDRGRLTRAEYRTLRREARMIRADAMRVANLHDGRLPKANFHHLQARVAMLNTRIMHDTRG